jgi:hypothetical protein
MDMENVLDKHNLVDPKIVLYGTHQKIHKIFASPNIRDILSGEFRTRKGDLVVSGKLFMVNFYLLEQRY